MTTTATQARGRITGGEESSISGMGEAHSLAAVQAFEHSFAAGCLVAVAAAGAVLAWFTLSAYPATAAHRVHSSPRRRWDRCDVCFSAGIG